MFDEVPLPNKVSKSMFKDEPMNNGNNNKSNQKCKNVTVDNVQTNTQVSDGTVLYQIYVWL